MYVFEDPAALPVLCNSISHFARIGEIVSVEAKSESLRLSVANASRTVTAGIEFTRPSWRPMDSSASRGPIMAVRTVQIKAKAAEAIFRRVSEEREPVRALALVLRNGIECIEVGITGGDTQITRTFKLSCIEVAAPSAAIDFDMLPEPYWFDMTLTEVEDLVSPGGSASDEGELRFSPRGQIDFYARRAAVSARARGAKRKLERGGAAPDPQLNPVIRDLSTVVSIHKSRFEKLHVYAPWTAKFRLKEFRTMVQFLRLLPGSPVVHAAFGRAGEPLVVAGGLSQLGVRYQFQFVIQHVPIPHQSGYNWVNWPEPGPFTASRQSSRTSARASRAPSDGSGVPAAARVPTGLTPHILERDRGVHNLDRTPPTVAVEEDLEPLPSPPRLRSHRPVSPPAAQHPVDTNTDNDRPAHGEMEPDPLEMGATQGAEPARGLFD